MVPLPTVPIIPNSIYFPPSLDLYPLVPRWNIPKITNFIKMVTKDASIGPKVTLIDLNIVGVELSFGAKFLDQAENLTTSSHDPILSNSARTQN